MAGVGRKRLSTLSGVSPPLGFIQEMNNDRLMAHLYWCNICYQKTLTKPQRVQPRLEACLFHKREVMKTYRIGGSTDVDRKLAGVRKEIRPDHSDCDRFFQSLRVS